MVISAICEIRLFVNNCLINRWLTPVRDSLSGVAFIFRLEMNLFMNILNASERLYNKLPTIESAFSELVRKGDWEVFINEGLDILVEENIHHLYGIFLLHKHFKCPDGHRPEERVSYQKGGEKVFVTSMQPSVGSYSIPYRFVLTPEGLLPIEFTSRCNSIEYPTSEAVEKIYNWLDHNDALDILGLSLLHSDLSPSTSEVFLERTEMSLPSSVVQIVHQDGVNDSSLPTTWTAHMVENSRCEVKYKCMSYCSKMGDDPHERNHPQKSEHNRV